MDRHSIDWRGYIAAITTPFDRNGALDLKMLDALLGWLCSEGVHGIVVAGTTGEWFSMSPDEIAVLLERVGRKLSGKTTIIAGCNAYTATEVLRTAEVASSFDFDGILLTPPPYIRPTAAEIEAFYRTVNQSVKLPICVYNWPPGTGVDMDIDLLTRLADLDKVVAIKNSTSNREHFLRAFHKLKNRVRIFGVPMNEHGIKLVLDHDADGMMGAGAVLGHRQPGFFNALWRNDVESARHLAVMDNRLMKDWFTPEFTGRFASAQAILKAALNMQGLPGGYPRPPILPVNGAGLGIIEKTLSDLGLETLGAI